jgi:hypothetical protein
MKYLGGDLNHKEWSGPGRYGLRQRDTVLSYFVFGGRSVACFDITAIGSNHGAGLPGGSVFVLSG